MTLFDDADLLLRDALLVTAHARPQDGDDAIEPGAPFVATVTVENQGVGETPGTHARTAFRRVVARIESTPFAAPVVDGQPVKDITLDIGELIFGEASSHEIPMQATSAMDGSEPFARVHVHGVLDLERFFSAGAVHQFTTDIRRAPATDAAAEAFRTRLLDDVLPPGFQLHCWSFDFDGEDIFLQVVDDPERFRGFVRERVVELAEARGLASAAVAAATRMVDDLYIDVLETGYTGALALALWFIGFDQGESFGFDEVCAEARTYLGRFDTWEHRRELRLFKGFENDGVLSEPITVVDLPVVVDYQAQTVTIWAGSLQG